jgi:hypothetical protein
MAVRREDHYPCTVGGKELGKQQPGKFEMAEMVCPELYFEAVGGKACCNSSSSSRAMLCIWVYDSPKNEIGSSMNCSTVRV